MSENERMVYFETQWARIQNAERKLFFRKGFVNRWKASNRTGESFLQWVARRYFRLTFERGSEGMRVKSPR